MHSKIINITYSIACKNKRFGFMKNNQINGEKIISLSDFKPGAYIIKLQNQSAIVKKRIIIQ